MKTLSKPSGSPLHPVRADKPGGPVTVVAGSPAPSPASLVLRRGNPAPANRPPRLKRVPVALPARIVGGLLLVPQVLAEIEFRERLVTVRAANVMIRHGVSQNRAADGLGISRSRLCVWRQLYAAHGEEALRPSASNAGRKPAKGRARRHAAFIELKVGR